MAYQAELRPWLVDTLNFMVEQLNRAYGERPLELSGTYRLISTSRRILDTGEEVSAFDADRWPDDIRLSDLAPLFVCGSCGRRGIDVRPLFGPSPNGHRSERLMPISVLS